MLNGECIGITFLFSLIRSVNLGTYRGCYGPVFLIQVNGIGCLTKTSGFSVTGFRLIRF